MFNQYCKDIPTMYSYTLINYTFIKKMTKNCRIVNSQLVPVKKYVVDHDNLFASDNF